MPFLAAWALNSSPIEPRHRLQSLPLERIEARARIREVLDWLVDRHRALPRSTIIKAVGDAIRRHCDEMLSDATYESAGA